VRTKPLVGEKLWFGPRRFGWGWGPASWEGWVVVAAFLAVAIGAGTIRESRGWSLVAVGGLLLICWIKGTSPGGPAAARRLKVEQERERRQRGDD
jgi:hypothetical protein